MSVLVFGSVNADIVFRVPALPAPGETVLGPGVDFLPGGKGANQAVAAARDGATVAFAGAVGADQLAEIATAALRDAGVDLTRLAMVAAPTGCAGIAVDAAGQNQIVVGSGANLLARAAQVEDAALHPGTVMLLQMEVPAAETATLMRRAAARGASVVLNLAPLLGFADAALEALRGGDHWLIVNENEAAGFGGAGATAAALRARIGCGVVITRGAAGAEVAAARHGPVFSRPALRLDQVVDTTGAGDCFCGVFAAALDRGLDAEAAARRAVVAAGLACLKPGAASAYPQATETDSRL